MTRWLAARLGVDPVQWAALVRVSLLCDWRQFGGRGLGVRMGRAEIGSIAWAIGTQLLYGGFCAFLIGGLPASIASSTIYYSLLLSTLGLALLVDFTGLVLSPDDHIQLAPRPVSDRTFFVARLTSVVAFSLLLALPFATLPALAYLVRDGGRPIAAALTSLAAAGLLAILVPVVAILVFVGLARVVPAGTLHRTLGYVQFALSFVFVGGFLLLSRSARALDAIALDKSPALYLNPAVWFASWIEIADGHATRLDYVAAVLPVAVLVGCLGLVRTRLSLAYASRLAVLQSGGVRAIQPARRPVPYLIFGPAHHAVSLLARAQFRSDQKFRLGVLGILPLTVLYLIAGFQGSDAPGLLRREPVLVYYAVLFFPVMLRQFLVYSEAFRASWVFHAAPMPMEELVVALKNTVVARFLVPYLGLVMLLLGWLYPRPPLELLMHTVVIGLLSHALLTADLLVNPSLPFSRPTRQGTRSLALLLLMTPTMAIITTIPLWRPYLYERPERTFVGVGILVIVNVLLHERLLTRVERLSRRWAFSS